MAQSLSRLNVHLVFSTKHRESLINDSVRDELHRYMAALHLDIGCPAMLVNSVPDHVHILFELSRTIAVADLVEDIKKKSSKWIKTKGAGLRKFAWQSGYGAFAVSESNISKVRTYIATQEEHHRKTTFQDEFRAFLKRHRLKYDERYVWD